MDQKSIKLKELVKATLDRISKEEDGAALKRIHANVERHPDLADADRDTLNEAIMQRLRVVSPAIAKRLGGPKDAQGREFLAAFLENLSETFDLSGNQLKSGVKSGGFMLNGTRHVDVYISYKTATGKNLSLVWIQEDAGSKPYLQILMRQVGTENAGTLRDETFEDPDKATEAYTEQLQKLLNAAQ